MIYDYRFFLKKLLIAAYCSQNSYDPFFKKMFNILIFTVTGIKTCHFAIIFNRQM